MTPAGDGNAVELVGDLAALLRAGGSKNAASITEAADSGLLVAGTRNCLYLLLFAPDLPLASTGLRRQES